ncbi:UPF0172-domain-containing protein [Fistulina hepatica ATCC 64428]|uniref:UPF0172-domain-containing protein n=1 Tax=Fistulina hepatica ATCC 64428 TaxID=1128425 RepID=A0A0D7A4B7_9AGAR|nr:UPF0172-domain-containing protein [Fistulina hepatica ATCC 64428]
MIYEVSQKAYFKMLFHCAKYPQQPVNGVLLGKQSGEHIDIIDAIPLLHHWTSLSPMMEIGLGVAQNHAESSGMQLVAYYQASCTLDDTALAPVGEVIASKIKSTFKHAVAFVIDGERIGSAAALVPYVSESGASWQKYKSSSFESGSQFQLSPPDVPTLAMSLVRREQRHLKFGDFDDHLEDVTIDWLNNSACMVSP